jgi:predicted transcriptional regulator
MGLAPSSAQAAVLKAIKGIEDKVDNFVYENFPATFPIVEIQEKDSVEGYAIQVLIAGGSSYDLQVGDRLKVVEVTMVEVGEKKLERKKEIGELKITEVEDENFSSCSVESGGDEISKKIEAKAKLLVITQY